MNNNYAVFEIGALEKLDQHSFSTPLLPSTIKGKKFLKNELGLTAMEVSFNKFPPGAAMPFGRVQFSPDTERGFTRGMAGSYVYGDKRIKGFSINRFSGAGCQQFGDLLKRESGGLRGPDEAKPANVGRSIAPDAAA